MIRSFGSVLPAGEELAKAALCVKLPVAIDAIVRPMENRLKFMRQAIEKLRRDGLLTDE